MDQWTVKWTFQRTPDDGRVTAETYVGWIEQKYENKKGHSLVKKLKILIHLKKKKDTEALVFASRLVYLCFLQYITIKVGNSYF
jgi:hypothetical protein